MPERIDTKAVLERKAPFRERAKGGPWGPWKQHFREAYDALAQEIADREADRKLANEWDAAARHLLEHYPEDVFPPNSNTPDAKAGTFARRLLTWLLDPAERARLAALAAEEKRP